MELQELVSFIIDICKKNNLNKVYICGNGSSGKTTLSKALYTESLKEGVTNLISLDDYLVDINLRKNSLNTWQYGKEEVKGRYTSSVKESYFLKGVEELLYNIDNGLEVYYFPLRYKEKKNIRKMYPNYFLTILEGVGTIYLDKDESNSLTILLKCSENLERIRRQERTKKLNRDISEEYDDTRTKQFISNVLSKENTFDMIIESSKDYTYQIIKSKY